MIIAKLYQEVKIYSTDCWINRNRKRTKREQLKDRLRNELFG